MSDNSVPETEDDRLTAAEYVLGVLGAPERREVEQRIARDQVFAREVALWEERLGGVAGGIPGGGPPAGGWGLLGAGLEQARGGAERRGGLLQSPPLLAGPGPGASA